MWLAPNVVTNADGNDAGNHRTRKCDDDNDDANGAAAGDEGGNQAGCEEVDVMRATAMATTMGEGWRFWRRGGWIPVCCCNAPVHERQPCLVRSGRDIQREG